MLVAGGILALTLFPLYASGQVVRSNIICEEKYNCPTLITMANGESLNPCDVTATFAAKCQRQDSFTLEALPPGYVYYGPTSDQSTNNHECRCNMFFYSVLSACAYCQGNSWIPWSLFTMNCSGPSGPLMPLDRLPDGVTVSSPWAHVLYGVGRDTFSVPEGCSRL